jgi:hypothetical protein
LTIKKNVLTDIKAKAMMILTLVVKDNLLKYIVGKDEPSTIWEILKKGFDIEN